jgi:hypothetical protein
MVTANATPRAAMVLTRNTVTGAVTITAASPRTVLTATEATNRQRVVLVFDAIAAGSFQGPHVQKGFRQVWTQSGRGPIVPGRLARLPGKMSVQGQYLESLSLN